MHAGRFLILKTIYLVKDLARATGHSVYTVEYYLKEGLIREFGRGPETGYRYFDETAVLRLGRIRRLRRKGASIKTIKVLLHGGRRSAKAAAR
jgi:DNA-binding transcriptional MerR regulator